MNQVQWKSSGKKLVWNSKFYEPEVLGQIKDF